MAPGSTLRYEVVEGWEQLPSGYVHRDVAGVATDSEDRVYLICRGDHPIIVYDAGGKFLRSWGQGEFTYRTHGITVGPDEMLYCTDDGNHTVRKFTPDGKLLLTLGTMNKPSDTGYDGKNTGTVSRPGTPFNRPTNLAVGPKGDLYVSDGYGNCRVHQYSSSGELKRSWGTPGGGPGEFFLPHGIAVAADGRVFVCDRENDRIQVFRKSGEFVREFFVAKETRQIGSVWDMVLSTDPEQTYMYVADGGNNLVRVLRRDTGVEVSAFGRNGRMAGQFHWVHNIAIDSKGNIYTAEVDTGKRLQRFTPAP